MFKRDGIFRARLKISSEIGFFESLDPLGWLEDYHWERKHYPAGRKYYTCTSKTIKSVSVSVIFFVINSETIQECKCNGKL